MKRVVSLPVVLLLAFCWPAPAAAQVRVPFRTDLPAIDGLLDDDLRSLPSLDLVPLAGQSLQGRRPPRVRLAYGADFLYLFVDVDAERFLARDRAYQNGDGVVVVLATTPPNDSPAEAFWYSGSLPAHLPPGGSRSSCGIGTGRSRCDHSTQRGWRRRLAPGGRGSRSPCRGPTSTRCIPGWRRASD